MRRRRNVAHKAPQKQTQVKRKKKTKFIWYLLHSCAGSINAILVREFIKKQKKKNSSHRAIIIEKNHIFRIISTLFLITGVALILFPSVYAAIQKTEIQEVNQTKQKKSESETLKNDGPIKIDGGLLNKTQYKEQALRIVIPNIGIDLPIIEANIVNGYWELSETTASHGMGSANPGEMGNTVIFAHARDGLFLPLRNIKKDHKVYVLTQSSWQRYKVVEIKEVSPDKVEVIQPSKDERITLFTCSGFLDSKRLIVVGIPDRP